MSGAGVGAGGFGWATHVGAMSRESRHKVSCRAPPKVDGGRAVMSERCPAARTD